MNSLILAFAFLSVLPSNAAVSLCSVDPFCPREHIDKKFTHRGRDYFLVTVSQQTQAEGSSRVLNQVVLVTDENTPYSKSRSVLDRRQNNNFDATFRTSGGLAPNRYSIVGTSSDPRAILGFLSRFDHRSEMNLRVILIPLGAPAEETKLKLLLDRGIAASLYRRHCGKTIGTNEIESIYLEEDTTDFQTAKEFRMGIKGSSYSFEFLYDALDDQMKLKCCKAFGGTCYP